MVCPGRAVLAMGTTTQESAPIAAHMASAVDASATCACLCPPASGMATFCASYARPSCARHRGRACWLPGSTQYDGCKGEGLTRVLCIESVLSSPPDARIMLSAAAN